MKRHSAYILIILVVVLAFAFGCVEGLLGPGEEDNGGDRGTPPDAPTLVYPADSATDVELRPTFQWTDNANVTGFTIEYAPKDEETVDECIEAPDNSTTAQSTNTPSEDSLDYKEVESGCQPPSPTDSYRIQVDDNSDFSGPLIDEDGISEVEFRPSFDLDTETTYYWRVRASNEWGDSDWTAAWSFTTRQPSDEPPDTPDLIYPANSATDVELRPTFDWTASMAALGGGRFTSVGVSPLSPAEDYHIQVDNNSGFGSPEIDEEYVPTDEYRHDSDLDNETTYYWRVRARNDAGYSDWSAAWSFTTRQPSDEPPDTPDLIYPANGADDVELRPTFDWTASMAALGGGRFTSVGVSPLSPAEDYHIQVDNNSGFGSPEIDEEYVQDDEYRHDSDLDTETTYYWRVRARNDAGYSDWSTAWSFTTGGGGGTPPDAPTLIYPENGQTDVKLRPRFQWSATMSLGWAPFEQVPPSASTTNATAANGLTRAAAATYQASNTQTLINRIRQSVEGYNPLSPADSYRIQVDNNSDFSSPEIDMSGITDTEYRPSSDLDVETRYYWRVRAHNQWGDSPWSSVWSFTTTPWHIETVDSEGGVGNYSSLALDSSGNPHISYYDYTNENLKYARWNGSSWQIETVDSAGDVGLDTSLALDSSDYPHISYYDSTNDDLKYARWTGSSWQKQTVDSEGIVGYYTSLALDSSDYPHISYYDYTNRDLKYARWTGSSWQKQTVDSAGHVGNFISLALDSSGNPHISYFDYTNENLKYARWNGSSWQIETVDSEGYVGLYTSLALDSSGNPHISYYSGETNGPLKYARWNGSSWQIETVDSYSDCSSIALDALDNPHISYHRYGGNMLKYACWNGSSWQIENVDSTADIGWSTSLALDSSGTPHISYKDENVLKYAHKE